MLASWRKGPLLARVAVAVSVVAASPSAGGDEAATFADRADDTGDATRSFAFLFDPLALSAGVFGAEADFALGKRMALAVEGDVYRVGATPDAACGLGLLIYPLRFAFHGLYVEPRFVFARGMGEPPLSVNWGTDVVGFGGTVGWQWTWDYGLSVRFGGGAMEYVGGMGSAAPNSIAIARSDAVLVVDASIGWAF